MVEDGTPGPDAAQSGWVTTRVAAEALGVDPRTVRKYINRGELNAKVEGEGVEKTYLVSIDSVYALRERRPPPRTTRTTGREESAESESLADMVRDLTADLMKRTSEAAELRTRLELTEKAESTLQAERDRLLEDLERERARLEEVERNAEELVATREEARREAQRLAAELETERSKGFWRRLFRG